LVLNNSTLLRVLYNKISTIDVLVTFSPSNIPFVLLNEFNFGMITFTSKTDKNYHNNHVNFIKITDPKPLSESLLSNISKPEHYDLKYVSKIKYSNFNYITFNCSDYIFLLLNNLERLFN